MQVTDKAEPTPTDDHRADPEVLSLAPIAHDWLLDRMTNRGKVSFLARWLLLSLIPLGVLAVLAYATDNITSRRGAIGFVEDYNLLSALLYGIPVTLLFYCLVPNYLSDCLAQLNRNGVFGPVRNLQENDEDNSDRFLAFVSMVENSLSSRILVGVSAGVSAAFLFVTLPAQARSLSWVASGIGFVAVSVLWFFMYSIAILLVLRLIVGIGWISRAFQHFRPNIRPLYPDGVGGLRPLSQLSLRLGIVVFAFGIELGLNQYLTQYARTGILGEMTWAPDVVIPWIFYVLSAPVVFFAPLVAARPSMQNAKNAELLVISQQFERRYKLLRGELLGNGESIGVEAEKITDIRRLHALVTSFPVWPFQFGRLVQFSATVITPIILTAVSSSVAVLAQQWLEQ